MPNAGRSARPGERATWRERFLILGTPPALSLTVYLSTTPLAALGPLIVDRERIGLSVGQGLIAFLVGQVAMAPVFILAGRWVPRVTSDMGRAWATVFALAASAVSRALALGACTYAMGITSSIEFDYRIVSSVVIFAYLIIAAGLVAVDVEHRNVLADLRQRRGELRSIDAALEERAAEVDAELAQAISERLQPTLGRLDEALESLARGHDRGGSLARLTSILDNEVRPLSHEVAAQADAPAVTLLRGPRTIDRRSDWTARVQLGMVIRPLAGASLLFLFFLSQVVRLMDMGEHRRTALLWIVAYFILVLLVRKAVWHVRLPAWLAMLTAGAVFSLALCGIWAGATLSGHPWLSSAWIAAIIGEAFVGFVSAGWTVMEMRRREAQRILVDTIAQLEVSTSLLRQRVWFTTRRLGLVLHGSLQSALLSAVMRISAGEVDDAAIADMKARIKQVVAGLPGLGQGAASVPEVVAHVTEVWAGVCDITCEVADDLEDALLLAPISREAVAEVITEGVQNAVRHGGATRVQLSLHLDGPCMHLTLRDNGRESSGIDGLGSRLLNEVCVSWKRVAEDEGTSLSAVMALMSSDDAERHHRVSHQEEA